MDDTTTTNTELDDYTEYTDAEYLDIAYEIHNGDDNDDADIDDNNDDVEDDANVVSLTRASQFAYVCYTLVPIFDRISKGRFFTEDKTSKESKASCMQNMRANNRLSHRKEFI